MSTHTSHHPHGAVEEHLESSAYLAKRQLRSGSAGWLLLAGLGISYVISGDYSGWNFGLAHGGFGGLAIAAVIIAGMYLALVLGMAELSSALPAAGVGYTFARRALGPWGGFATGTAILIEYSIAPAAIANFIGSYVESLNLFGIRNGWWIYLAAYAIFIGIHLSGVGEALKVMFVITAIALVGLIVFAVSAIGHFDPANLTNIAVDSGATGASSFLPHGYLGIWAAIPFAIWFFLAIEGVAMAAEEAKDPHRTIPRAYIGGILTLVVLAAGVMFLAGGAGDWSKLSNINDPLPQAMKMIVGEHSGWLHMLVWIGLFGLVASFHGIILGYSRQIFALARSGYLPGFLAAVHPRFGTPWVGVLAGGVVGILAIFSDQWIVIGGQPLTANIVTMSVLGAIVMYIMSMASLFVLRRKEPGLARPFPAIGYPVLPAIALVLAVGCLITMVWFNTLLSAIFLGAMAVAWVYFHFFTAQRRAAVAELTVVSVEVVQTQG